MKERFDELKKIWKNDTMIMSNGGTDHWAYLEIIRMGKQVVPFIIEDMRKTNNHWFVALEAITGANVIPVEHYGQIELMTHDWLNWFNKNLDNYTNRYFFIGFTCKIHTTSITAGTGKIFYNGMPSYKECVKHIHSIYENDEDIHSIHIISISEFKNEQDYKTFLGL